MDAIKLQQFITNHNLPKFRTAQIAKAVFRDGVTSFSEISTLSKDLRETFEKEFRILSFDVVKLLKSKDNASAKALVKLADGNVIETVLMSPKPGLWSVCVSSQVGCALGCGFCATGALGLRRNLTAEEITDQVLLWRQYLLGNRGQVTGNSHEVRYMARDRHDVTNIVFMGMGEPFMNWEQVGKSIQMLTDKELFGFGSRSISISTVGIPDGIRNLAKEFPQVNLAISLHFPTDDQRLGYMPVNKRYRLSDVRSALQDYFKITRRKVFIEYIMLDRVNDTREDAMALAEYLNSIGNKQLLHVNLIRYNQTSKECVPSPRERTIQFKNQLSKLGIAATIRKSLGQDIQGACGQLAGER